jgi:type IV pilus assembly protein PilW
MNKTPTKHPCIAPANQTGFTLVELMVALFISSLAMAAIVVIYCAQSKSYSAQDEVSEMQQNLRGILSIMPMEIRTAGCKPTGTANPGISILTATNNTLRFTRDLRDTAVQPGGPDNAATGQDEDITYTFGPDVNGLNGDTDNDGITGGTNTRWSGTGTLRRTSSAVNPISDNLEALEFNYILSDGTTTTNASANQRLNDIRTIQVSLLMRATHSTPDFWHNNQTYTTASGIIWTPPNDNFRRRFTIININCRNMGI